MKALIRDRFGPPEILEVREVARPVPKEREVLVHVRACSLNDWDWGLLHEPTTPLDRTKRFFAPILGSDIAGIVVEAGSGVRRFKPGDEVYGDLSGFGGWGGFAEFVCASERRLALKSPRMTFEQAAALPQAGQLAVQALAAAGPLKAGQKILINGAGGGVGTIGVQLAKSQAPDIEVTGVDSAMKLEMMRRIGFDHVIDYTKEDFTKSGRQYDLIVDTKTMRQPSDHIRALAPGGTYATVGGPSIARLLKIPLVGWWFRLTTGKTVRLVGLKTNRDLPYMNEQFEAGKLTPVIDGSYTLDDAREAFRHFGAGNHQGKIVITISPGL
jgi:NADPH:quinone reductase-like Zn-dependent oxidoreductase